MTKPTKLAEERGMVLKNIGDCLIYFCKSGLNPAVFIFQPFYIILAEIFTRLNFNDDQIFI